MQLAELTYRITARFPPAERSGLVSQMRRASVSVGSCIADGCGCGTDPGFSRYLQLSLSSLLEVEYQSRLASRLGYGDPPSAHELDIAATLLKRKLVSLKNAVARRVENRRARKRSPDSSRSHHPERPTHVSAQRRRKRRAP